MITLQICLRPDTGLQETLQLSDGREAVREDAALHAPADDGREPADHHQKGVCVLVSVPNPFQIFGV